MPTYAYQCDKCGHSFDAFQKFADAPLSVCPVCEGHIRRVIHPTPVVFKGSGWYITDSRAKANGSTNAKSEPKKADDGKADTTVTTGEKAASAVAEKPDAKAKTAAATAD